VKNFILVIAICAIGIFQATLLDYFRLFNVRPDLLLISMVMAGLYMEKKWAISLGILAGLIKDIFVFGSFGINTLLFALWSFCIVRLSKKISIDDIPIFMLSVFLISMLNDIIIRLIFLYLGKVVSIGIFLRIMILESFYTAMVSILFFRARKFIDH
jgi:rod shape-determining protein MreD